MRSHARVSDKLAWRIVFVVYMIGIGFGCTVLVMNQATSW